MDVDRVMDDGHRDGVGPDAEAPAEPKTRTKRQQWLRALAILGIMIVGCTAVGIAGAFTLANRYEGKVDHADILGDVPVPPTPAAEGGPLNYLLLGSDSRSADPKRPDPNGERSDTIMILHVSRDLKSAFIISIPRDSYVNVPAGGRWKGGKNKINSAFAFGGAKLAAKTVYELTKVPLDGAMIVNFDGIKAMVAEVGTVEVCIPYEVRSTFTETVWSKGCHDMGPTETEEFMRQRKGVPGGDFGRIHDQQLVVKALAKKIASGGILTNPFALDGLIVTAASSLTVDNKTNLRELVFKLKGIDPENIKFATVPYLRTMQTDAGSSVELDMKGVRALFEAVNADTWQDWLAAHPQKTP